MLLFPGLPAHLEGDTGYKKLCQLLGRPTTKQQIELAAALPREPEPASGTGEAAKNGKPTKEEARRLIEGFYRDPSKRSELWRQLATGAAHTRDVPSFECQALKSCLDQEIEQPAGHPPISDIARISTILPRRLNSLWDVRRWVGVRAWSKLDEKLNKEPSLNTSERASVSEAAVAIATILDDARVVEWCRTRIPALSKELDFVPSAIPERDWKTIERFRSPKARDHALARWRRGAESLERAARRLTTASSPSENGHVSLLTPSEWANRISSLTRNALSLQRQWPDLYALHLATDPEVAGAQIGAEIRKVDELRELPWLRANAPQIRAFWNVSHFRSELSDVQEDLARVRTGLGRASKLWARASRDEHLAEADQKEAEQASDGDSINPACNERFAAALERRAKAQKKMAKAKQQLLDAISPTGREFDAGKDYEEEWRELSEQRDDDSPAVSAKAHTSSDNAARDAGPDGDGGHLSEENRRLRHRSDRLEAEIREMKDEVRHLKLELKRARSIRQTVCDRCAGAHPVQGNGHAAAAPENVENAVRYARERWPKQLAFGNDVQKGVGQLHPTEGQPAKILHHLAGLAAYCDLRLGRDAEGLLIGPWLSSKLNINASGHRKGSQGYSYHDLLKGEKIGFKHHTKPKEATASTSCPRIYYRYDKGRNMVSVGWIGPHPE